MSANQTPPISLRLPGDLRSRTEAAATAAGVKRNAWITTAIEEKLALDEIRAAGGHPPATVSGPPPGSTGRPAGSPALAERAARAAAAKAGPLEDDGKVHEYRFQTRPVGSIHQWRQDGASRPRTASTLAEVRERARAAIAAAGETRQFTIKLVPWRD